MKPEIEITDNELVFTAIPKKGIGPLIYCKSFRIDLDEIKFIALSPRLLLDDEEMFLLFVDQKHHVFPVPYYHTQHSGLKKIERTFETIPLYGNMNLKFTYDEHGAGKKDKVIFPNEHFWEDLFEKDWRLILRGFYGWIKPKSFFGTINKKLL